MGAGPDDISILAVNSAEFNLVGNRVTSFTIKMWLASNVSAATRGVPGRRFDVDHVADE